MTPVLDPKTTISFYFHRIHPIVPLVDDFDDISIRSIDHPGIVAGAYDSTGPR